MQKHFRTVCVMLGFFVAGAVSSGAAEKVLLDFSRAANLSRIKTTNAKISQVAGEKGKALRVQTGHVNSWPGIAIPVKPGEWDLAPYAQLELTVKNTGSDPVTVNCRVDNPGANGTEHCLTGQSTLAPGQTDTVRVSLKRTADDKLGGKLFGLRGYPVSAGGAKCIDIAKINQILVFVNHPKSDATFEILNLRATGSYVKPTAWTSDANPFFPFIDTFGQYKHKDWPGKVHSLEELKARREQEAAALKAETGPKDWDKFGGWAAGPQLTASGFFRTEKYQGKWWLVDPEGRLFFSHGVDCVGEMTGTPITDRETWFDQFPGKQPEFSRLFGRGRGLKGYYAGKQMQTFSFESANLMRKYGANWPKQYGEVCQQRLRSWGLNTIANWSTSNIYQMRRTPYTDAVSARRTRPIEGGEGYWAKFPDVYDPAFAQSVRQQMESKRGASAGDPWCLGYFTDNEMSWGDDVSHAVAALKSPADQPAKIEFIKDLKAKYGSIEKLNAAWGTGFASWDAMLQSREGVAKKKEYLKPVYEDLNAFYRKTAETYFKIMRDAIKAVAPNQLYIGCRFAGYNASATAAASKYCDVVSFNIYKHGVGEKTYEGVGDMPMIIGEFHFGALDRGMFHTGLVPVADQQARAQAYIDFVRGALRHPQFVGTGWFKWQDEPNTGRPLDEENYQIGFLDVADTPYPELVAASREVAGNIYQYRLEQK